MSLNFADFSKAEVLPDVVHGTSHNCRNYHYYVSVAQKLFLLYFL